MNVDFGRIILTEQFQTVICVYGLLAHRKSVLIISSRRLLVSRKIADCLLKLLTDGLHFMLINGLDFMLING